MKNAYLPILLLCCGALLSGCGKPHTKLVGIWVPDVQESKNHNNQLLSQNPFAEMALNMAAGSMRFEFTDREAIAQVGGDRVSSNYEFVSEDNGVLKIKTADGNEKSVRFLTDDTVVFVGMGKDGAPELVFRRVK